MCGACQLLTYWPSGTSRSVYKHHQVVMLETGVVTCLGDDNSGQTPSWFQAGVVYYGGEVNLNGLIVEMSVTIMFQGDDRCQDYQ